MRASLIILAIIATCGALYVGSAVLIPIALALFGALLLLPLVERLHRWGLSRLTAAGLVMVLLGVIVGSLINFTLEPARGWMERAPSLLKEVERKLRPLKQAAVQLDKVAAHAEQLAGNNDSGVAVAAAAAAVAATSASSGGVLRGTVSVLVPSIAVFFMIFFLLACGPPILYRFAESCRDDAAARRVIVIGERVRREMSRYLVTLTVINVILGIATTGLAYAFELPNPVMWGVMAGIFNFIPYVGSATTLVVLALVTLLTHDLNHALGIAACYLALDTIEGQLIQPLAVGNRLSLNPLAIFLALWLGAGIWGVAGMLLATPILLTVRIICRRIPSCRMLNDFLAPIRNQPFAARARAWRRQRRRKAKIAGKVAGKKSTAKA